MKEISIGLRISFEEGLSYFGIDEVNQEIAKGGTVTAIKEGNAIMRKKQEDQDGVQLSFSGFTMTITIDEGVRYKKR